MALKARELYPILKKYTDKSIEGTSGVIAGKNCQILSIESIEKSGVTGKRVTFSWYKDGETVARTDTMDIMDGADGADGEQGEQGEQGEKGEAGFSPEITVAEATSSSYKLNIKTEDSEFETPNLKGSGGGVNVNVKDEKLIFTY